MRNILDPETTVQPRLKLLSALVSGWLWSSSWAGPWLLLVHTRARTHADVQTHIHIHIHIRIFMNMRIFNRHIAYLIPMQKQTKEYNSTHIVPMRGADWWITIKNISAVKSHDALWRFPLSRAMHLLDRTVVLSQPLLLVHKDQLHYCSHLVCFPVRFSIPPTSILVAVLTFTQISQLLLMWKRHLPQPDNSVSHSVVLVIPVLWSSFIPIIAVVSSQ
jgi:hypothetical protein